MAPELDLEADRLRALMRANVFKKKHQPVTIGRFEIVRLLGSGAMGIVYEAVDPRDGEAVAIKVLRSDNPRALTMFKKEFRALSLLSHPNLVALYELGRADQQFFFTMELVRGIPLQRYLWGLDLPDPTGRDDDPASSTSRASALSVSPVTDFERLRDVFGQLAAGVSALHQAGKLHRDIKPTNALVTDRGRVVLMDFGFVSEQGLGPLDSTQGNMVVGTPAFMAPEQARAERATAANDWYSVGATLYMTLTGQAPFGTLSLLEMMQAKQERAPVAPRTLVRGIPEDLGELCLRLLDPDPSRRPDEATIFSVFRRDSEAPRAAAVRSRPLLGPSARPEVDVALYGRDDVLASLVALHEEAIARGPVVAFLRGRAGVGKSAVAREFTRARTRGDAVVLKARCYERDATLFKTVDGVVDALARHLKDLDDAAVRAVLPARVEQLARLFPALLQVQAIARRSERADAPSEPADRSSRRTLEFAALKELLTKLSDQAPLVLWIDDLHWTDIDSARVLAELLRPPGASRLLLLATFRSEDADRSPGLAPLLELEQARAVITRTLDLGPLAVGDCEAIARALLQRKIPDATASDAT
ncbi:MAG: serine/threonine-protein kinase PknK, partial [Myxococcales bacterium]|nr:serine/threonine-protein kinase PknK [Myxococcales bacterium]